MAGTTMGFELREHTADIGIEATGRTIEEVFGAIADGLAAAMCESIPASGERFDVEVRAENREALLFDYLDELIYQRDVRNVLPVDNRAEIEQRDDQEIEQKDEQEGDEWLLSGSARGVPLSGLGAREIKAVTYSEMEIEETDGGWRAYVVFDV